MCGIYGITSKKTISNKLFNGLKKLEYRGYDSSGIAGLSQGNKNLVIKSTGPINHLKKKAKSHCQYFNRYCAYTVGNSW